MKRFFSTLYTVLFYALFVLIVLTLLLTLLLCFPLLFFVLPCLCIVYFFVTRQRQKIVLQLVLTALETQTPLDEVLDAYADTCWGLHWQKKVHIFAARLRDGFSIVGAARAVKGILRYDAVGILHLEGDAGVLRRLLSRTAIEQTQNQTEVNSIIGLCWFCFYLPCLVLVPAFLMMRTVPQMRAIFDDFLVELPGITKVTFLVYDGVLSYGYLLIPYFLAFYAAVFLFLVTRSGLIRFRPWGVRTLMRSRDAVSFLRIFAVGLEQNKTIFETTGAYKQVVPSRYLSWKASRFIRYVERGKSWIEALRNIQYLTRSETALLQSAVQVRNVPQMLYEIAANKEQRQIAVDRTRGETAYVLIIVIVGVFVCIHAVAFFLPLVKLIHILAAN